MARLASSSQHFNGSPATSRPWRQPAITTGLRLATPTRLRPAPSTPRHAPPNRLSTRTIHTTTVHESDITRLASTPLPPLTLASLIAPGRPPLTPTSLLTSANHTLTHLPVRLAHRLHALRRLPYIVVSNPRVTAIHANYLHSLSTLLPYAERRIETLAEEAVFTEVLGELVRTHANTIEVLAKGFLEARRYLGPAEVRAFLDGHLRARIGTRLLAEQHIALHAASIPPHLDASDPAAAGSSSSSSSYIGVIDTALSPASIVRACEATVGEICELKYGVRPSVRVVGGLDARIAHVPMHLEYVVTELLKNSFRATIEAGMEREAVEVTIAAASAPAPAESGGGGGVGGAGGGLLGVGEGTVPGVTLRIRDRGGGISPATQAKLWDYGFTTFNEDEIHDRTTGASSLASSSSSSSSAGGMDGMDVLSAAAGGGSSLAGLGYGLPLGRAYAEYFGGGVEVQSLWGWGTDVYLKIRGVGDGVGVGGGPVGEGKGEGGGEGG